MTTVHDFSVTTADGREVSLREHAGKHLLIVNTASKCGLTPQYEGLEALYRQTRDLGVEVLAFPCNQFRGQELGTDDEIQEFCRTACDVTFPVFARVDVNGDDAAPLYRFLRSQQPGDFGPKYGNFYETISQILPDAGTDDVKWNFTKFLVSPDGEVLKRYEPPIAPDEIRRDPPVHDQASAEASS